MTESRNRVRQLGDEVSLADVVWFLRRHWLMILGTGLGAGLLTVLAMVVLVPPTYEASATLIIVPPRFSSELKPQTLTVQGYQKLLESDAVLAETKRRLAQSGALDAQAALRLGKNLSTRIFVSRRSEETELAPMIQATARFGEAETAAEVANAWADVFLERIQELMGGTTSVTVQLIDQQYPQAKQDLVDREQEHVRAENMYEKSYNNTETEWDRKITEFRNESSAKVGAYKAETRRLLEQFSGDSNLDTRSAQVDALRKAYGDLQDEQARVESQLELTQLQLEAAQNQLAATPQFLTLRKAISDEALWNALASSEKNGAKLEALENSVLITQEINPVHTELSTRAARIEVELNALAPRAGQLIKRLDVMSQQMKDLDSALRADKASYERLERERESGLEILEEECALQLAILDRGQQQALGEIKRDWDSRVGQLDREIEQQTDLFKELAQNYNEATLAKAEQMVEDVRLGAPAVAPERAKPRNPPLSVGFAILLGLIFGAAMAAVVDVSRQTDVVGK